MKKIAIVGDGRKPDVGPAVDRFVKWLEGRAKTVLVDTEGDADLSGVAADILVVFGGDGSMLSAARR